MSRHMLVSLLIVLLAYAFSTRKLGRLARRENIKPGARQELLTPIAAVEPTSVACERRRRRRNRNKFKESACSSLICR